MSIICCINDMHDTVKKHIQEINELLHTSLVSITVFKPYLKKILFRKCNHSTFTSNKMYLVNSYNIKFYLC